MDRRLADAAERWLVWVVALPSYLQGGGEGDTAAAAGKDRAGASHDKRQQLKTRKKKKEKKAKRVGMVSQRQDGGWGGFGLPVC